MQSVYKLVYQVSQDATERQKGEGDAPSQRIARELQISLRLVIGVAQPSRTRTAVVIRALLYCCGRDPTFDVRGLNTQGRTDRSFCTSFERACVILSYLHAPVTAQGDDVVAEDGVLVRVELSSGHLGGGSHARGIGNTLRKTGKKQFTRPNVRRKWHGWRTSLSDTWYTSIVHTTVKKLNISTSSYFIFCASW